MQDRWDSESCTIAKIFLHRCVLPRILVDIQVVERSEFANSIRTLFPIEVWTEDIALITKFFFARVPPSCDLSDFLIETHSSD